MRRVCNVAYAVLTDGFDEDDRAKFDATLAGEPEPLPKSRGTEALLGMMMGGGRR